MTQRLKVLASVWILDPGDVGGARILYEWIHRLADHVDITLVTAGARLNKGCGFEDDDRVRLVKIPPRLDFKRWDVFDRIVHPGYLEFFFRARKRIRQLLREEKYDVLHHFAPRSIRYASPFLGLKGAPIVIGPFHGGLQTPAVMKEFVGREGLLMKCRAIDRVRLHCDPILRRHFKTASKLLVSADYLKDVLKPVLKENERDKFVVVPPPPGQLPAFRKTYDDSASDTLEMMFVGRLVPMKGLELVMEAMTRLKEDSVHLTVYGRGKYEEVYKNLARQQGIDSKITWAGFVPNDQIHKNLVNSDVFLFPSLREPAGIAVAEAMGLGVPVIAVDYGGPSFIVADGCGVKVPIGTKESMVADLHRAMVDFCRHPEKRKEYGMRGRHRIETEFAWNTVTQKVLDVYQELARPS